MKAKDRKHLHLMQICLRPEQYARLREISKKTERSMSWLIRACLDAHLSKAA
jgi:hypothetical protein